MSARDPASRIELIQGDITKQRADAIVNAANTSLLGGGGVDGAIHRAAGPKLLAECRTLGGCPTGSARITGGYDLPACHVIHTVGPVYRSGRGEQAELLASCHQTSLELAVEYECSSVAFPAISCGAYGYPLAEAARIALSSVVEFLRESDQPRRVIFVLFNKATHTAFAKAWAEIRRQLD